MFQDVWKAYEENELTHSAAHHLMSVSCVRSTATRGCPTSPSS